MKKIGSFYAFLIPILNTASVNTKTIPVPDGCYQRRSVEIGVSSHPTVVPLTP